ncbi:hypothetical protein ACSFB2_13295, partial [Glaesserella parasuis]|uniref:hypothetical protein n=1 Tax=Glaesserella parasuis TaxID=738 RepID=UPI003F33C257
AQLTTDVETKLFIGHVAVEGALPRPLADLQFGVNLHQERLTDFKIKDLALRIPDYGTTVGFAAAATVGPDFMPSRVNLKLNTQVIHSGDERLPGG